jgi:hypothetical protein
MVVAVVAVAVVQAAVHQVVEMVAVGHQRMAAAIVTAPAHHRGAAIRVRLTHGDDVLIVVALVRVVQVTVVEIVYVVIVLDAQVPAVLAMHMGVVGMNGVGHTLLLVVRPRMRVLRFPAPPPRGAGMRLLGGWEGAEAPRALIWYWLQV